MENRLLALELALRTQLNTAQNSVSQRKHSRVFNFLQVWIFCRLLELKAIRKCKFVPVIQGFKTLIQIHHYIDTPVLLIILLMIPHTQKLFSRPLLNCYGFVKNCFYCLVTLKTYPVSSSIGLWLQNSCNSYFQMFPQILFL